MLCDPSLTPHLSPRQVGVRVSGRGSLQLILCDHAFLSLSDWLDPPNSEHRQQSPEQGDIWVVVHASRSTLFCRLPPCDGLKD